MMGALRQRQSDFPELYELRGLVREVTALGAKFRIYGATVHIDFPAELPAALRDRLIEFNEAGWLYHYLGGEQLDTPALTLARELVVDAVLVETRQELRAAIRQIERDRCAHGGLTSIDIETGAKYGYGDRAQLRINQGGEPAEKQPEETDKSALDPHCAAIATLQMYAGGTACFICRGEAVAMLLQSHWLRRGRFTAHGADFELSFLQNQSNGYRLPPGRRPRFRLDCSMQATGLLTGVGFGGAGRSLAAAAEKLLGVEVPKQLQKSDWTAPGLSPGQLAYAATDAVIAWKLHPILSTRLAAKDRLEAYELQRRVIPAVVDMGLRGLLLDREEHRRQYEGWSRELATARREYLELTGQPPPSTQPAVRAWLDGVFTPERRSRWKLTPTGLLSTEATQLKFLSDIPSAQPVLAILAKEKLISSFGPRLAEHINPVTGRIHCDYNIAAQKAGRCTASNPNLQQLPSRRDPAFKGCLRAAEGYVMVGGDYGQVELRGGAWLSHDRALTRVFAENRDLHIETAAKIARIPVDMVTKVQRDAAKPVNYGAVYGIGAATLVINAFADYGIVLTLAEAQHALDAFFAAFPQLAQWRFDNYNTCKARGFVRIGCGRVVEAAWEPGGLRFTQCCNLPIQGICADCIMRAITMVHLRLRAARVRGGLVASVHDELLLEVHEDDAEKARTILEETMIEAFTITFPGAPITGLLTAKIGTNWSEVK